jgi:hypothetical protein
MKLMGPRINTCFVPPPCGLYLTCRGENMHSTKNIVTAYIKHYQHMCDDYSKNEKPLNGVVDIFARM